MKPHLLFLTSTNLASNPRCRKEIKLAVELGYQVTYIAFDLPNWTKEKEDIIQKEFPSVHKIYLQTSKANVIKWSIASSLELFLRKISFIVSSASLSSIAVSKRSLQLLWSFNKLKEQYSLVIAHNPPAFYPAYYFSRKNNIPFAIDIEDYHPGEGNSRKLSRLTTNLIKKVLPFAKYVSFAAPLIKEKIALDVFPEKIRHPFVIDNVFPSFEFLTPDSPPTSKIRLVWFSQNIDKGRGLEAVLPAIESLSEYYDLTLIGNIRENFFTYHLKGKSFIRIIPSLQQNELNNMLAQFDIGLAIETSSADENRDICLTNKIWSYFQSGLFILASNTKAQLKFIQEFGHHGQIIDLGSNERLQETLLVLYGQWNILSKQRSSRYESAKAFCWEKEAERLKLQWTKT